MVQCATECVDTGVAREKRVTYVRIEEATAWQSRAKKLTKVAMAEPRRPQQARKLLKKVRVPKKRASSKKTQPKRESR